MPWPSLCCCSLHALLANGWFACRTSLSKRARLPLHTLNHATHRSGPHNEAYCVLYTAYTCTQYGQYAQLRTLHTRARAGPLVCSGCLRAARDPSVRKSLFLYFCSGLTFVREDYCCAAASDRTTVIREISAPKSSRCYGTLALCCNKIITQVNQNSINCVFAFMLIIYSICWIFNRTVFKNKQMAKY